MVHCYLGFPEFPSFCKDIIKSIRASKNFADVSLVGDDNIPVKAHKIVLSAHSNVFREAINALNCDELVIQCNGFLVKDINSLLDFMYLGETASEFKNAHVLFRIGKFLQIKHLSDECEIDQNVLNKEFSIEAIEVIRPNRIKSEDTFEEIYSEESSEEYEEDSNLRMEAKIIYKSSQIKEVEKPKNESSVDPLIDPPEKATNTRDQTHVVMKKTNISSEPSDEMRKIKDEYFSSSNTRRGERTAVNLYNSVMESFNKVDSSKEWKFIDDTPEDELPTNLCKFFMCLVKSDGTPYNSNVVRQYYINIARYLNSTRSIEIKSNKKYESVCETVKRRCKEIEEDGLVPGINQSTAFRKEDIKKAFDRGFFGKDSPEALITAVTFNLTVHLGCNSSADIKKLVNSDFTFGPLNDQGYPEYIQLRDNKVTWSAESPVCPVTNIAFYQSKKTQLQLAPGMPFLLLPVMNTTDAKNWFQDIAMGKNNIETLFRRKLEKSGVDITDQKISLSSGKKSRHISFKDL